MTERPGSVLGHLENETRLLDAAAPAGPGVDPLSDVLRMVRLAGVVFFVIDARSAWGSQLPDGATLAPALFPRAQHVISYHVVTNGSCWGGIAGGEPVRLHAGDVLVFPRGDAYFMHSDDRSPGSLPGPDESLSYLRGVAAGQFPYTYRDGGGGPQALGLVCGFLGCDLRPFNPLLSTLPRLLVVRRAAGAPADRLDRLVELTLADSGRDLPGGEIMRLRLSELMFVEVVRRHLATVPETDGGWLAGLRDEIVGRALGLLHDRPASAWTLDQLARSVGASRSVLADRFTRLVGEPPMQYLARWRMQVAACRLTEGLHKVSAVAVDVGYDSEAAFSRAFKKVTGVSPTIWRQQYAQRPAAP